MSQTLTVRTVLEPRGPAAGIVLDDDQLETLGGGRKAFPVTVTIGETTVPLRVARMRGETLIGFSKAVRAQFGVEAGDEVDATIAVDDGPREIAVPDALREALERDAGAGAAFAALAPSHRKAFATWVAEAKRDDTRDRRVAEAVRMLHEGQTR